MTNLVENPAYDWDYITSLRTLALEVAHQKRNDPSYTLACYVIGMTKEVLKQRFIAQSLTPRRHEPRTPVGEVTMVFRPIDAEGVKQIAASISEEALAKYPPRHHAMKMREEIANLLSQYPPDTDIHILGQAVLDLMDTLSVGA